jgi:ribosomal protein S18 acetylase RimI-like enzyme
VPELRIDDGVQLTGAASRLVPWSALPDLAAVAALLGMEPGEISADLAGAPRGLEGVALVEGGGVAAAGLRVGPAIAGPGRADLAWVSAGEATAALRLVEAFEADARRSGARTLRVVLRRAPDLSGALLARGWRGVPGVVRMRRGEARPPGPLPRGVVERSLAEAGLGALRSVWSDSFQGVPFAAAPGPDDLARLAADPAFDPGLVRVLWDACGAVGFLHGALAPGGAGEVRDLGVLPRGRRRGLGRWLLRRCAELLAAAGAGEITLRVAEANATALRLYASDGWTEVGRAPAFERGAGAEPVT